MISLYNFRKTLNLVANSLVSIRVMYDDNSTITTIVSIVNDVVFTTAAWSGQSDATLTTCSPICSTHLPVPHTRAYVLTTNWT
jgi:hypothetical protein